MSTDVAKSLMTGCSFGNGLMQTNLHGEALRGAYHFFRVAVLDGHIPLNKAIGFKLFSSRNMEDLAAIDRHTSCLENMVELSKNVSKVIFISPTGFAVSSKEKTGNVTAGNAGFMSDGKEIKVLDGSVYMYNSTEPLGIRVFAYENTGYHLMEENVEIMRSIYSSDKEESSTFFPLNTEHSLIDYINILPFDGKSIRYRLRGDFTEPDLAILWRRYLERCVR
jgi:hypothetical protein